MVVRRRKVVRKKRGKRRVVRKRRGLSAYQKKHLGESKVLRRANHLNGKTNRKRDAKRKALPPGKRKTAWGSIYYEYRADRSDKNRRRRL